jgi:hypothetical protein
MSTLIVLSGLVSGLFCLTLVCVMVVQLVVTAPLFSAVCGAILLLFVLRGLLNLGAKAMAEAAQKQQ